MGLRKGFSGGQQDVEGKDDKEPDKTVGPRWSGIAGPLVPRLTLGMTRWGWRVSGLLLVSLEGASRWRLVEGGVELQVPPLRFAPVGMTKGGVAGQWAFASGV
jgi:hypothetical protein